MQRQKKIAPSKRQICSLMLQEMINLFTELVGCRSNHLDQQLNAAAYSQLNLF